MALLQPKRTVIVGRSVAAPRAFVRSTTLLLSSSNRLQHPVAATQQAAWVAAAAGIDAPTAAEPGDASVYQPLIDLIVGDEESLDIPNVDLSGSSRAGKGAAPTPAAAGSPRSRSSDARKGDGAALVRISAGSMPAKVAGYLFAQFEEHDQNHTVCLMAVGSQANMVLLKALARLQDKVSESQPEQCVVFQPYIVPVDMTAEPGGGAGSDPLGSDNTRRGLKVFVTLGPRAEWPTIAFDPNNGLRAKKDMGADAAGEGDSIGSSSKSSASGTPSQRSMPMLVRSGDQQAGEAVQRIAAHALRSAERQLPAQFVVAGNLAAATARAPLLFSGVSAARKSAYREEQPFDLQCTLVKTSYEVPRSGRDGTSSAAAAHDDAGADAAAEQAEGAAAAGDADAAAGEDRPAVSTRVRYLITVQLCEPRRRPQRAGRDSSSTQDRRRAAASGSGARRAPRSGYIEVKLDEWNQLKEQLQVVPHLTEQLQIMTRQHEQLLSLLAAQQETQSQQDAPQQDMA